MPRLTQLESFRARTWSTLKDRPDVRDLSNRAHRLLSIVVWHILNQHNNGAITLGPRTLARHGVHGGEQRQAGIGELKRSRLLSTIMQGKKGAATFYALSTVPLALDPRPMFAAERQARLADAKVSAEGQVGLSAAGQEIPKKLTVDGQRLTAGGQHETSAIRGSRACARAR